MAVSLNIYRTFYHQYQWPYSDCGVLEDNSLDIDLPDRSIFDILVEQHANYPYTRKMCLVICTQVMTSRVCGCNTRRIGYQVPNISVCSLADELTCALNLWNSAVSLQERCSTKCPFECSQSVFHPEISYADQSILKSDYRGIIGNTYWCAYKYIYFVPSCNSNGSIDENLVQIFNYTYFFQVIVQIAIRYDSLSYIELEEEPKMSGEELLGIIGGHLGLFLGMSLLSFVELVELLAISSTRSNAGEKFKILKTTKDHVDRLNIVALPNVFRARHTFISIVWLVLFMASFSVCMFLVVHSIMEFTAYAVSTTVIYGNDAQTYPPAVTLCNKHPLNSEFAIEILYNYSIIDLLNFPVVSGNSNFKNDFSIYSFYIR